MVDFRGFVAHFFVRGVSIMQIRFLWRNIPILARPKIFLQYVHTKAHRAGCQVGYSRGIGIIFMEFSGVPYLVPHPMCLYVHILQKYFGEG